MVATKLQRLGCIANSHHLPPGMSSHLQCPIPYLNKRGNISLFFTSRDKQNFSHPFCMEISATPPYQIINLAKEPLFTLGNPGNFDSSGVMPSCILRTPSGALHLYYIGWNVPSDVPFHNSIGLAISEDDGLTFRRIHEGPILDRNIHDPLFVATPFVLSMESGYRMWYLSGTKWARDRSLNKWRSFYQIKSIDSSDGIHFTGTPKICVSYNEPTECAIARPWVVRIGNLWRMWFCARWDRYSIQYADSNDGINWTRNQNFEISGTSQIGDFDSEMASYPALITIGHSSLLFYNGNAYGQSGIGIVTI
jgi:hypothetical protein